MKYEVGQLVKFNCDGLNGFGVIVEICKNNNNYLVELQGEFRGRGHDGNGASQKVYHTDDYWWIKDRHIEYSLIGNKVVR